MKAIAGHWLSKERESDPHHSPAKLVSVSRLPVRNFGNKYIFTILAGSFPYLRLFL